ncbi:hypothetical protein EXS62_00375 [Candidatus Kaiserbacteria bacterium]|nr:hypothetical protein [Candidatus Kaiserbacteria bacterium]
MRPLLYVFVAVAFFVSVVPAGAHEVYVLSPDTIAHDLSTPSPNPFDSFATNRFQFFFWGFLAFVLVTTVFFASITHRFEIFFEPYLTRLRPMAPVVARVTLGLCLLASAYNHALFGPELPIEQLQLFGLFAFWGLWLSGVLIVLGIFPRLAALVAVGIFAVGTLQWGSYMLNYANYLGEMAVVLLLGSAAISTKRLEPYAFLILRIAFGISVIFASVYGKFIHSNLALSTVSQYHLTNFFPFDPLFIVLGACIIEVIMGIFFIIGFEVRHTALFFLFWIFLSLLYFGESVWPHMVLVGVNIALFMYGYDRWTVEGRLFNRGKLQPFL